MRGGRTISDTLRFLEGQGPPPMALKERRRPKDWNLEVLARNVVTGHEERRRVHNLLVSRGRDVIRDLILNSGPAPDYIAIGTSSSAAVDADEGLGSETDRFLITRRFGNPSQASIQLFLATTQPASPVTIRECGLFANGVVSGTLVARATFPPVNKDSNVEVTFTWHFPISS